ncbi:hypothetical protein ACLOAU_02195 [Niabella sp. CJ426]|uniref:hypothetical protein n=1 Tax=Niabella sp. CJ426 TaxID=3393740 RepID=UPI003D08AA71
MSSIPIPSKLNFNAVEVLLNAVNSIDVGVAKDIELPPKLTFEGFGIEVSVLQVFFKWMRGNPGKLILKTTKNNSKAIDTFAESFFAYVLLSTIWKKVEIVDLDGVNLKAVLKPHTERMNKKIEFLQGLPNDQVYLTCFDHYSKQKGLIHWFYPTHEHFVQTPSALENTIYRALLSVGKIYKTRFNTVVSSIGDEIDQIIWELFKNTDEHATSDAINSTILSPNTRGVCIKLLRDTKESLEKKADGHLGLSKYYGSVAEQQAFFLEISVFDSGPGLVKRFMGSNWNSDVKIQDEVLTVKECLRKGSTSVDDWKGEQKGFGLNEVLVVLSKLRGFIKIRTNRCSLYRDLAKHPVSPTNGDPDIELLDWISHSNHAFTTANESEGALITLAFPLPNTNKP